MEHKFLFQEKQKFTQWWLWVLLLGSFLISSYYIIVNNTTTRIVDEDNISNSDSFTQVLSEVHISCDLMTILIMMLPLFLVVLMFFVLQLNTLIDNDGIQVNFNSFFKRNFKWSDIESANSITYSFVGYGIRYSANYGMVYNVKGNKGLIIKLKNGKKRLIGTQKTEELAKVVSANLK